MTATDTTTPGNGGQTCTPTPPTATSCTFTGLTNGDTYTFTATASNTDGTGPASVASNAVVPFTEPGPPTGVHASPGNTTAAVSFTAPGSNGGSVITGYTVSASVGVHTCTPTPPTATSCTVTGLSNGTSYTFTVIATNAAGDSPPSARSNTVVPFTKPGPPTGVHATAGNTTATVSFTAPFNGGAPITAYTVTATDTTNPANGGQTCTVTGPGSGSGSCTVTGLTNGDVYAFNVTATNAAGTGPVSTPSNTVVPVSPPPPPMPAPRHHSNNRCSGGGGHSASNDPGPC